MGKILRSAAIGSLALSAALWCAAARAELLTVTWTEPSLGIDVSWQQESNPTPLFAVSGFFTEVAISDFSSTGTMVVGPYMDIVWNNLSFGGLFNTPDNMYIVVGTPSAQAYFGDETAPTFLTGTYPGMNIGTGADATVVISGAASPVPELSIWAMMLVGFAGLAFAGYRASRNRAALSA